MFWISLRQVQPRLAGPLLPSGGTWGMVDWLRPRRAAESFLARRARIPKSIRKPVELELTQNGS